MTLPVPAGLCLVLAAIAGIAPDATAQTPTPPAAAEASAPRPSLTLEQALDLAERHSPRLQTALAEIERLRSGVVTARTYPNPELELSTGGVRARVPGVTAGNGSSAAITQPIDLPTQRAPRIAAAESGLEGARHAFDEARLLLRADIRQSFYLALRRKAEFDLAFENQRLLEQIRNRIELSVRVGERARYELVRIEAEFASAVNQTNSARLRVTQALAQLRVLLGGGLPPDTDVRGELAPLAPEDPYEAYQARMLARYPALQRTRAEIERTRNRVDAERALRVPRPSLFAGIDRDPEMSRGIAGVSIPIPVWDRRAGPIGEAVAQFQQATLAGEQRRIELLGELEINWNRLLVARQQIAAFEGGLLRQAENGLRVAENAFRFGERGFLEVLDAQRTLRTVRTDFLNARFEKQSALIELDRLIARDLAGEPR
ncbi:MAG: TolC family protein [Burkholderiales bacterium]|nr:TolC family protein [Burkholderiales bacterium]